MTERVQGWATPGRSRIPEPPTWLSTVLRVVAVPATALLWWALGFLAWQSSGLPTAFGGLRPTLPVLLPDLEVAVFGPLGASLVAIALLRRRGQALVAVMLGFAVPAALTLTRGRAILDPVSPTPFYVNPTERTIMFFVIVVAAGAGLAIGGVAIGSLQRFGFLGLLAVYPVVSLLETIFLESADPRWLTRLALVALMVMIAWRRWSGVLLWPVFFVLYWLLTLSMAAVDYGGQTLRHRGGGVSFGFVSDAMLGSARSAWRVLLGVSWDIFWPAAFIAALVVAGHYLWRRFGQPHPDLDTHGAVRSTER